jgi:hypothetical protein
MGYSKKELTKLVDGISKNREDLFKMRDRLQIFDNKIDQILPTTKDYEKRYLLENKIKTIVEFNRAMLEVNKAIDGSLKSELELRRKLSEDENVKDSVSIKDVARALEEIKDSGFEYDVEEEKGLVDD